MYLEDTQCCAVKEIVDLRYAGNAKDAINRLLSKFYEADYIRHDYIRGSTWGIAVYGDKEMKWDKIPAFLTFTEVVATHYEDEKQDAGYPKGYGQALCDLILAENLGEVTQSQIRNNRVNHPKHDVKVYVWTPDLDALKKYAEANEFPKPDGFIDSDFDRLYEEQYGNDDDPYWSDDHDGDED